VYWLVQRAPAESPFRGNSAITGSACALLLLFASAGSATGNRYMPDRSDPPGPGRLTYNSYVQSWATKRKTLKSRPLTWVRRAIVPESDPPQSPPPE
jgi:hypothetical protein